MSPTPTPGRDLVNRTEVHDLVVEFYRAIIFDEVLGPVFGEVAEVDWPVHIPRLVDYWCRVLLRQPGYDGAILEPHRHVHELESFEPELFDRWFTLWVATIDGGWSGPIATAAKDHAQRMANTLSRQLTGASWAPPAQSDQPAQSNEPATPRPPAQSELMEVAP